MTANAIEGTAKGIPFPKGGRSGRSGGQYRINAAEDLLTSMGVGYVDCGSGSYHDAAIRDAKHPHEH